MRNDADLVSTVFRINTQIMHAENGSSVKAEVNIKDLKTVIYELYSLQTEISEQNGAANAYLHVIEKLQNR